MGKILSRMVNRQWSFADTRRIRLSFGMIRSMYVAFETLYRGVGGRIHIYLHKGVMVERNKSWALLINLKSVKLGCLVFQIFLNQPYPLSP